MLPGVHQATKKDGTIYYLASITFRRKHISLGSFLSEQEAYEAYCDADKLLTQDMTMERLLSSYSDDWHIPFEKCVILLNFRDNKMYVGTPIYMRKNYFSYFLSQTEELKFDIDDLFYYSMHKIMKRGGHLFVNDYGMQVTIASRYGIKSHAVRGRDYDFANDDPTDFRYSNIVIKNRFHGVSVYEKNGKKRYKVAYNKAVDLARKAGINRNYPENYVDMLSASEYADLYTKLKMSKKYLAYLQSLQS